MALRTAMQTVDLVIGGLGVVAVIATTLGVVFYEEAAGEQTVIFPERPLGNEFEGSETGVSAGQYPFPVPLGANATHARNIEVTITFTGQQGPQNPSDGSFEVRLLPPNGTCEPKQAAWSASPVTIDLGRCRWADPPASRDTTAPEDVNETITWDEDFVVEVEISDPNDLPLPTVTYTYDIEVTLQVWAYEQAIQTPDIDTL